MAKRRVVITGLGMVSPLGNDVQSSWSRLLAGESGAAEITAFDHTDYNVHFACELKDFDPPCGSTGRPRGGWTASRR